MMKTIRAMVRACGDHGVQEMAGFLGNADILPVPAVDSEGPAARWPDSGDSDPGRRHRMSTQLEAELMMSFHACVWMS